MGAGVCNVLQSSDGVREDIDLPTRRKGGLVEDMATGDGKGEHLGVVRGDAFPPPNTNIGDALVWMGVLMVGDNYAWWSQTCEAPRIWWTPAPARPSF